MYEESLSGDLLPVHLHRKLQMGESLLILQFPQLTYIMLLIDILHRRKHRARRCPYQKQWVFPFDQGCDLLSHLGASQIELWVNFTVNDRSCYQLTLVRCEVSWVIQFHKSTVVWACIAKMLLIGASSPVSVFQTSGQVIPTHSGCVQGRVVQVIPYPPKSCLPHVQKVFILIYHDRISISILHLKTVMLSHHSPNSSIVSDPDQVGCWNQWLSLLHCNNEMCSMACRQSSHNKSLGAIISHKAHIV